MNNALPSRPPLRLAGQFFAYGLCLLLVLLPAWGWAQCTAPTGLAVSNVTGTTATLSFAGPAAATSFTVSYTYPGGGTAQLITPNPTAAPVSLAGLLPVTTYTVSVASNCAGATTSPAATLTFRTRVLNDEPCVAVTLPLGGATCQPTAGSTFEATPTPANGYALFGCGIAFQFAPADVWYRFTTAATGPASTGVTVTVSGASAGQLRLFSAATCSGPFAELACTSGTSASNMALPLVAAGLLPNTTYYVRVSPFSGSQGAFTICVTDPPACGNPNFVRVGAITATTAQLLFFPGPGNTGYTVTYVPLAGGTPITMAPSPTSAPITITGLVPLTNYVVTVQATCASGGPGAVSTLTLTSGHPQDEPAGAVPIAINATCQPTVGTLMQATATVPNGYGAPACSPNNIGAPDVWYSFTTAATGLASQGVMVTAGNQSTTTPPNATLLRLFSSANGAAGPFTALGCSVSDTYLVLPAPLIVGGLLPSTTYYVTVGGGNTTAINPVPSQFQFTLCLTAAPACPAPTALAATLLSLTSARLDWQTTGSGVTTTVEYGPTGFVPGTSAPGAVLVPGLTTTSYTATALTSGQPYQFYVSRDCGAGALSSRSGPVAFQTQVLANDEPCGAVAIPLSGATCTTPTAGTMAGATQSDAFLALCGSQNPNTDVWYTFTTAATGSASTGASITVTGTSATHIAVGSASSCAGPFTTLGCSTGNSSGPFAEAAAPIVLRTLTPSTTYYVRIGYEYDFQAPPAGPITVCVTDPAACNNITNPGIAAITATSAQVTFSPAVGSTGYAVTLTGPTGIPSTFTTTARPIPLTGLLPGTVYTVTVVSSCGGGQALPVTQTFSTMPAGPVNEVCTGALPVACGQTIIASTINAQPTTFAAGACNGTGNGGVFYSFVGTGDNVEVSTCHAATNFSTAVRVFTGICGGLTCVGGATSSTCSLNSEFAQFTFLSQPGVAYFIYVLGTQGPVPAGTFGLTLTCTPPPCPAPSAAVVGLITSTTARVSFTPATGTVQGYIVTATPPSGGTPITAQGPASPIALAGLQAGTSYTVTVQAQCGSGLSPAATATFATLLASRNAALAAQVDLYPNPAHAAVALQLPAQMRRQPVGLTLYNPLGQAVREYPVIAPRTGASGELTQLDLTGLPPGIYTVQLRTNQGTLSKRLVIE